MMLLFPETTVYRKAPINTIDGNNYLFASELKRKFNTSTCFQFDAVKINSSGIFWKRLNINKQSQRHVKRDLKIKDHIKFLMKYVFPAFAGKKPALNLNKTLWVTDSWSLGYFHWIGDVLPLLEVHANKNPGATILLPSHYQNIDFVVQSVKLFGFTTQFIGKNEFAHCDQLIVSELIAPAGNYIPEVICDVRSRVLSAIGSRNHQGRKLFISRKNAPKRNLINEKEVQKILLKFGFETVYAEKLNWQSQVKLFSEANVIVAQHGAGLTNMIFMPEGGKLLEIRAEKDAHNNCYFSLASALGHGYYYLESKTIRKDNDHIGDMLVDTEKLSALLSEMN